jgi:ubiquinone/menaquinone biosynthesis C-methylase UbiE
MTSERIAFYGSFYEDSYTAVGAFKKSDAAKEVQDALTLMGAQPPVRVLDWCGGWGRHAIPAAKLGYRMVVLDFSERYIERAKRDAKEAGVELETVVSDFR